MGNLAEDVSKAVDLLIYRGEVELLFENTHKELKIIVGQEALDKHGITENEFRVALQSLVKKEKNIKRIYEYADGDIPTGFNYSIEYFHILIPRNFKQILEKYRIQPTNSNVGNRVIIFLRGKDGVCRYLAEELVCYGGDSTTKRHELLGFLHPKKPIKLELLAGLLGQKDNIVMDAISDINEMCGKKLGLGHNLIINTVKGYKFNTKEFEFSFRKPT